jgi:hypothetical protein
MEEGSLILESGVGRELRDGSAFVADDTTAA